LALAIKTVRTFKELESFRGCWEALGNHPNSDFHHFQLVCRLRPEVICPHVTFVENDGQLRTLLAARLEKSNFVPSIGYFKPIRIPAKVLTVLHQGSLGQMDGESAKGLVQHLWSLLASGEADAVAFHHLREDSPLLGAIIAFGSRWWCEKRPSWSIHWSMTIPEELGFLLKKLRSKHRSWIRKKQRELETAFPGQVTWKWISSFDDVPGLCVQLEDVAARTYQRGLGAGFVNDDEHRQRFALFASREQLRVQLLEVKEKVCAFWIGINYLGTFHSWATGFDPDLRGYEIGTLVFVRMVDELVREGVRKLDFGLGDALYKQRFGDKHWREATIRMFAPTAKGLALRSVLGLSDMMDSTLRRLIQRAGVLDRIKSGWRQRLAKADQKISKKYPVHL
jgi:hypothetical protein